MSIEIYGYKLSGDDELLELREVSLCVDAREASALSEFFARCARAIETDPGWEHEHFSHGKAPDVIVVSSERMAKER